MILGKLIVMLYNSLSFGLYYAYFILPIYRFLYSYTSLPPANSYFETSVPSEQSFNSFPSTLDNQNTDPLYTYNPDLSNLALQNMNLVKFNDLSRISEEGDALSATHSKYPMTINKTPLLLPRSGRSSEQRDPQYSMLLETEAKLMPMMDTGSVVSEQVNFFFVY